MPFKQKSFASSCRVISCCKKCSVSIGRHSRLSAGFRMFSHAAMLISEEWLLATQAMVTDPTPIHVLGGNIVPLSQGGMNTNAARSNPLSLLVALAPVASGNSSQRCTGPCTPQQVIPFSPETPQKAEDCTPLDLEATDDLQVGQNCHMTCRGGMHRQAWALSLGHSATPDLKNTRSETASFQRTLCGKHDGWLVLASVGSFQHGHADGERRSPMQAPTTS